MSFEKRFRSVWRRSPAALPPSQIPSFLRKPLSAPAGASATSCKHVPARPRRMLSRKDSVRSYQVAIVNLAPMPWWMVVTWIIAVASVFAAIFTIRRNRYQVIKLHKLETKCTARHPDWSYHNYLKVEILSVGADVYDLCVRPECDYSYWTWRGRMPVDRSENFSSVGELANPLKNGQIARFELGDHAFRNLRERHYADTRKPSQLWPGRVRIAVYQSGRRPIFILSSWRFRSALRVFDNHELRALLGILSQSDNRH
jgi:hypothetical protein